MIRLRAPYVIQRSDVAHVGAEFLVDNSASTHGLFALHAIFLIGGLGALGYWFGPQIVPSVAGPAARTIGAGLGIATGTALTVIA